MRTDADADEEQLWRKSDEDRWHFLETWRLG